jgi:small subunit ribosomal protein S6
VFVKHLYETMVVYDGTLSEDTVNKEKDKVKALLSGSAEVEKVDDWGRRELAYIIRKKKTGHYVLFFYAGEDGSVCSKLDKMLRSNESVLRFLIVQRHIAKKTDDEEAKTDAGSVAA